MVGRIQKRAVRNDGTSFEVSRQTLKTETHADVCRVWTNPDSHSAHPDVPV